MKWLLWLLILFPGSAPCTGRKLLTDSLDIQEGVFRKHVVDS